MIPLNEVLIYSEVVQVHDNPEDQHDPEGGLRYGSAETAEGKLAVLARDGNRLPGTFGHPEHYHACHHNGPHYQDNALDDIGPYHRLDPADQRVERDQHAGNEDDRGHVPPGQSVHRQRHGEKDRGHAGDLGQEVTRHGIQARPRAETLFQMVVGRNLTGGTVERDEHPRGNPCGDGQG